jgi:hypothetical protein
MALTLEDKWAIQEVVNRFCHYSDYGDWDRLRALYTPDSVTELVGLNTRFDGPDQQLIHAQHSYENAQGRNRHYNHNLVIDEVSDDEAWARYYIQQLMAQEQYGATQLGATARMEDRLVRTADGWKIAERRFNGDQSFQLSAEEMENYAS